MFDEEFRKFSGGGDRISTMLGMSKMPGAYVERRPDPSAKPYYDVKMPTYQKSRSSGFKLPQMPALPIGAIINVAILAAVGIVGYKLYQKFFGSSAIDNATDKGKEAIDKTFIPTNQANADQLKQTAASLKTNGMAVSSLHTSLANTFHSWLDSMWVDHEKIVATILNQDVQTFRLMSVAYGSRELTLYIDSHPFSGGWSVSNLLSFSNKQVGTLKEHLQLVLSEDELTKIHSYISVI